MIIALLFGTLAAILLGLRVADGANRRDQPRYFSNEYRTRVAPTNVSWMILRRVTFALTLGRDVVFPIFPAQVVDHLGYAHLGSEIPLRDVVPLSRATHAIVTAARDGIGRGPVNAVLRCAFAAWLVFDYQLIAMLAQFARLPIPPLIPVASLFTEVVTALHAIQR